MPTRIALTISLVAILMAAPPAPGQDAVSAARVLLAAWHEEPARIDRARVLLETVAVDAAPATGLDLSYVWFLTGDFRARGDAERIAAYERGGEWARRAISAVPNSERAHFLLAINTGRLAELRGVMRALPLVKLVREQSDIVLRLNPSSVDGLILAASLAAELPALMGGDRARAEALFKAALGRDPHQTGGRLGLARLYVATRRWQDANRELQAVVDEPAATDLPRWMVDERPRAQGLLAQLHERGLVTGGAPQAP